MAFNLKLFDTMGMITLVTPPSMINPGDISFLLIDLKEDQKNQLEVIKLYNLINIKYSYSTTSQY